MCQARSNEAPHGSRLGHRLHHGRAVACCVYAWHVRRVERRLRVNVALWRERKAQVCCKGSIKLDGRAVSLLNQN